MEQLTLTDAINATNDGICRAAAHAESSEPGWHDLAFTLFIEFAHSINRFQCEDARFYAEQAGLPEPPSKRAWGSVVRRAIKSGVIEHDGYEKLKDPSVHRTPAAVWKSTLNSDTKENTTLA